MASGDWQVLLETGAERDLGRLSNPSLVREAREVIDDVRFDPVPPSAVKMRRNSDRLQKISEGRIVLEAGTGGSLSAPSEVGNTGRHEDESRFLFPKVVEILNECFGHQLHPHSVPRRARRRKD